MTIRIFQLSVLLLRLILLMTAVRTPRKNPQRQTMTMRILPLPVLLLRLILLIMVVRTPCKYPQRQTMTIRILQLPVLLLMSILLIMMVVVRAPHKYLLAATSPQTTKRTHPRNHSRNHQKVAKTRPQKKTRTPQPRSIVAQLTFSLTLNRRTTGIAGWSSSLNTFRGQQQGTRKNQFASSMRLK